MQELGAGARGRRMERSPARMSRGREPLLRMTEDWERRRSHSPRGWAGRRASLELVEDPLAASYYKPTPAAGSFYGHDDPMMFEASFLSSSPSATLCSSPDEFSGMVLRSPEYIPGSQLWVGNQQPSQAPVNKEDIVFGPGVQLVEPSASGGAALPPETEVSDNDITDLVHRMEIDTVGGVDPVLRPGSDDGGTGD